MGPRPGEIILPRWRDAQLNGRTPTIALERPKTENGGVLPLHLLVAKALRDLKRSRAVARGGTVREDEHIFLSRYGRPFKSFPDGPFRTALKRAGLADKGYKPHGIRGIPSGRTSEARPPTSKRCSATQT